MKLSINKKEAIEWIAAGLFGLFCFVITAIIMKLIVVLIIFIVKIT